jgi:hypothetical protein
VEDYDKIIKNLINEIPILLRTILFYYYFLRFNDFLQPLDLVFVEKKLFLVGIIHFIVAGIVFEHDTIIKKTVFITDHILVVGTSGYLMIGFEINGFLLSTLSIIHFSLSAYWLLLMKEEW